MKKLLSLLKSKLFAFCSVLGLSSAALAEGGSSSGSSSAMQQIGTAVVTELQSWTQGVTDFFTTNIGTIMTVLGVAISISLVWMVFKIFRKGANKVG